MLIFGDAYPVETVALRLFNVFGPGQALSNPYTGVLANFGSRLVHGERPTVFEDGQQKRDFVHVRDVARAFRLAMESPDAPGHVINIGSRATPTPSPASPRCWPRRWACPSLAPRSPARARAGRHPQLLRRPLQGARPAGLQPRAPAGGFARRARPVDPRRGIGRPRRRDASRARGAGAGHVSAAPPHPEPPGFVEWFRLHDRHHAEEVVGRNARGRRRATCAPSFRGPSTTRPRGTTGTTGCCRGWAGISG